MEAGAIERVKRTNYKKLYQPCVKSFEDSQETFSKVS
jgi:hypothetical protein